MMTTQDRVQIKRLFHLSVNDIIHNPVLLNSSIGEVLLFLHDRLALRISSQWQDTIIQQYGFSNLVYRINKIRAFWGLDQLDIDYTFFGGQK